MDPVDVLTKAVMAAQFIRSASDPEAAIRGGYGALGREPPMDQDDAIAVRVARLMAEAGDRRRDVFQFLQTRAGPLPLNRPDRGWPGGVESPPAEPEPEAIRLLDYVEGDQAGPVPMFPEGFGPFEVARRSIVASFEGPIEVERVNGRAFRLPAGGLQERRGTIEEIDLEGLPTTVRGLIDYPIGSPVLFPIETGEAPWSLWDICCAIADQYDRMYEDAGRYGIWGHDITDLWIESLLYYPGERLIYPQIGS